MLPWLLAAVLELVLAGGVEAEGSCAQCGEAATQLATVLQSARVLQLQAAMLQRQVCPQVSPCSPLHPAAPCIPAAAPCSTWVRRPASARPWWLSASPPWPRVSTAASSPGSWRSAASGETAGAPNPAPNPAARTARRC